MTNRDGLVWRGRLVWTFTSGFWTPSRTQTDPSIPYLPLESPEPAGTGQPTVKRHMYHNQPLFGYGKGR